MINKLGVKYEIFFEEKTKNQDAYRKLKATKKSEFSQIILGFSGFRIRGRYRCDLILE